MRVSAVCASLACVGRSVLLIESFMSSICSGRINNKKLCDAYMVWADDSNMHHNMYACVAFCDCAVVRHTQSRV